MKSLAVFCGSRAGSDSLYMQHAVELGELMAQNQITLIYGGGCKGMMGAVADAVLAKNGKVIGVIPEVLTEWEQQHTGLTELHVVKDMHVRKKTIYELCDAAVVLPGGCGTLDELFEIYTWNTLKIHNKHIFILNTNGFYNYLIKHFKYMYKQEFLYNSIEDRIKIIDQPLQLLQYIMPC